jgi:hypothetical protein
MMMQQAQMEQQMAQQQDMANMKEQGANYRKELDVQGKIANTGLQAGLSEEASAEDGMLAEASM